MAKRTVRIAVTGITDSLPLDELDVEFQGNVKISDDAELAALEKEIEETGYAWPIAVVRQDGRNKVVGGKRRVLVLRRMRDKGWKVPPVPIFFPDAKDVAEAKRRVIQDISQYGKVDAEGMHDFLKEDFDLDLLKNEQLRPVEFDTLQFIADYFPEKTSVKEHERVLGGAGEEEPEGLYTKKVMVPIYEPKLEQPPPVGELVDTAKTRQLFDEIERSGAPEEVKEFLRLAAHRHSVFHYERIAEYYAHAPKPVQDIMERSALVIIDFNKAIENGFVAMSERLASEYRGGEEAGDEQRAE